MRKIILVLIAITTTYFCQAQAQLSEAEKNAATQLITSNQQALGLTKADLGNFLISNSYEDNTSGIRYVYITQTYLDVPVYNQMQIMSFRNGKLLSQSGGRIGQAEQRVNVSSGVPAIPALSAVMAAMSDKNIKGASNAVILKSTFNGRKIEFNKMGVAHENITAKLIWFPDPNGKSLQLAWQVFIASNSTPDYWLISVDAVSSKIIGVDNLTVYDNWHNPSNEKNIQAETISNTVAAGTATSNLFNVNLAGFSFNRVSSPALVNASTYRVIPFPAESPQAAGGAPAIRTNPWTAAPGNATTLKWHTGLGGLDYDYTRGNNAWAYQDRDGIDGGSLAETVYSTTTPDPLTFDFVPNFTVNPLQSTPVPNVQFSVTNLFYWTNIIHDVMYQYGFTEAAANFQDDNLGRGGVGNDHVNAEAQDGSGTNNANFSTPADGGSGRMQMYIFNINSPSPSKDGSLDNGVVVHEYGHGISNRLTGGGTGACLSSTAARGMGEGWSDYYALMFTQNWATATNSTGFTTPRPTGTYALSNVNFFPASPPNSGIRNYAYCTNMAVNPLTYAYYGVAPIGTEVHNLGEIWCVALWDMTWNIIQQENLINPNIYEPALGGGNTIAMKLVTEGLKLQPCNPGFIDARNAILQADINLYGGAHICAIKEAFRRRGMGEGATQNPVVASFSGTAVTLTLLQNNISTTPEGQNINYTNRVVSGLCNAENINYTLRDTLPASVTFVSATAGGTYNPGNRVVSWAVNIPPNTTQDYNFVVSVNTGVYFPENTIIDETVAGTSIPAAFTATSTTATQWNVSAAESHSPANSFFATNLPSVSDMQLTTTNSFSLSASPPNLSFWHYYNSESTYDGGVVEISINGGATWTDIGAANFILNGYNKTLNTGFSNPLPGRQAFSGNSSGFIQSVVNLTAYANQANVKLRWRFGSDASIGEIGWYVDDIKIQDIAKVHMRTSMFNDLGVRLQFSDSVMIITAPVISLPAPTVSLVQPSCATSTGTITVTAPMGAGYTYSIGAGYQAGNVFNNVAAGPYSVTVNNNGSISPATPVTINAQPVIPATPAEVQGPTNVCAFVGNGTQLTYSVPAVAGATSYTWVVPPTVTLVSGQGTNSIVVTINAGFVANANKLFRVTASSSCGTSAERLFWILVQFPTTPSSIGASTTDICPSLGTAVPVIFGIAPVAAASSYIWSAQAGTTIISHPGGPGVNDTVVLVTFSSGFSSSLITVSAVNDCGVSGTRSLLISRKDPSTPSLITGPTNACEFISPAGSAATYSVPQGENVASYTWSAPLGAIGLSGQGSNTISFTFPVGFTSGLVNVLASNGCGTSNPRSLSISRLNPATPGVIDVINTSFCPNRQTSYTIAAVPSNATSLLWTIPASGTLVSGQGTASIIVSYPSTAVAGSVTVTSVNNCGTSVTRSVDVKLPACPPAPLFTRGNNPPQQDNIFKPELPVNVEVYPNPTHDNFRVRLLSAAREKISARILDLQGREIKGMIINPGIWQTFGSELKSGVYMIEVIQGNIRIVKKLIKI